MNFHKTIGFLAALLLMVGIGVPDSFAQNTITLTLNPTTIQDNVASSTVTASVNVTFETAPDNDTTVTVRVTAPSMRGAYDGRPSVDVEVPVTSGNVTGTSTDGVLVFAGITQDKDDQDITVTVTASAPNFESQTATLEINDNAVAVGTPAANSVSGFRVEIVPPSKEWTGIEGKVKVRLLRRQGPSFPWGNFSSISVGLFDESQDGDNVDATTGSKRPASATAYYSMTISQGTNNQLSSLGLEDVKKDTLEADAGGAGTQAFYTERSRTGHYDTLEFVLTIPPGTAGTDADLSKVYAVATLTSGDLSANNQIESRDTETKIHSAFDDVVGDGRLIKIDRVAPGGDVVSALTHKIANKNGVGGTTTAGIKDQITLSVTINGIFNDTSVLVEIIDTGEDVRDPTPDQMGSGDEVPVVAADAPLVGFSKTFMAREILDAGGEVSHKFTVSANQFKRKATTAYAADKVKKNDLLEADNMMVRARAQVTDKAGNKGDQYTQTELDADVADGGLSAVFTLDSKPPKITIAHPDSSHKHYTSLSTQLYSFIGEGDDVDLDLNPLNFSSDEATNHESFIVIGADSLILEDIDFSADDAGLQADLGALTHRKGNATLKATQHPGVLKKYNKGAAANLKIGVRDEVGNLGTVSPKKGTSGNAGQAIFDNLAPTVSRLFPNTDDLSDNKIGGGTQHPVFRISEAADSILVRYEGSDGILEVAGTAAQKSTVGQNIRISFLGDEMLQQDDVYDLQVYVRDKAGYVGTSGRQLGLTFDNNIVNPSADQFVLVTTTTGGGNKNKPAVIAGQALHLEVTARDATLKKTAVTYSADGVMVSATDSDGNMVSEVSFGGTGVTDNGDGSATLNGDTWTAGVFEGIVVISEKAGTFTVAVTEMGADGVATITESVDITVDAADFADFEITAWEEGVVGAATSVWGDFTLRVVPTDKYGNPSLKAFKQAPANVADTLNLLDANVVKTAAAITAKVLKYDDVDVTFRSNPALDDLPSLFEWPIPLAGETFELVAPDNKKSVAVQVLVANASLDDADMRSRDIKATESFTISAPLDLSITLWVPGMDGDQAGETVTIPAGGEVEVTARAEGLDEGDTVTFNVDGDETEATADASGYATQSITLTGSGTVSVTATSGQYSTSLDIVHEEQMGRRSYVDANGDPVYLIAKSSGTVGVDDFLALVAAWGSSPGDANYNPQADINDDDTVDVADFLLFITSWGRTIDGPASKPIVLAPGVNENAEFSLSLGSERVVAGELVAVDVSLANVASVIGYGFTLNYDAAKFEFVSVAQADEDLLTSTGGETLFHHIAGDGQVEVATGMYNGTAVSGGGDIVRFVFRVLYEFEDNARFEIANGLVFDPSQLQNPAVVAGVLELQSTPREFALHQNFPNPFNPDTTIKYDLAESADVTLQIYNVLGQVVRTLVASEAQNAGRYQIRWNGMDERGVPVSSGIYFYQIAADGKFSDVRKLMLLK